MGIYFNPSNNGFKQTLRSQFYVDKTGMIFTTDAKRQVFTRPQGLILYTSLTVWPTWEKSLSFQRRSLAMRISGARMRSSLSAGTC